MFLVKARFETDKQARFELEDLTRQRPFVEDYAAVDGNTVVVRCTSEEKAKKMEEILREVTTSSDIEIVKSDGSSSGAMGKVGEFMEGVQKGVQGAQKGAGVAADRVGGMAKAPEGGMLNSIFSGSQSSSGDTQSSDFHFVTAMFDPEKGRVDEAAGFLLRKGVPSAALDSWVAEGSGFDDDGLQVNCSSREKAESVREMLEENFDPVKVVISKSAERR